MGAYRRGAVRLDTALIMGNAWWLRSTELHHLMELRYLTDKLQLYPTDNQRTERVCAKRDTFIAHAMDNAFCRADAQLDTATMPAIVTLFDI
jgi:hypothetical protein